MARVLLSKKRSRPAWILCVDLHGGGVVLGDHPLPPPTGPQILFAVVLQVRCAG